MREPDAPTARLVMGGLVAGATRSVLGTGKVMIDPAQHPLAQELWSLHDAPPASRVAAALRAFQKAVGETLANPPTSGQLHEAAQWLVSEEGARDGPSISLLVRSRPLRYRLVHPTVNWKAGWLQQAVCPVCEYDENSRAKRVSFPIRIRPFSAQTKKRLARTKELIRESLKDRFSSAGDWADANVCIWVVAVMGKAEPDKDVDNLVKGLLDALQGIFYENDARVQHLSAIKLRYAGDDSHYLVDVRPVHNYLEDVVYPGADISWPGMPEIVVE
jgi:Endodeoxyribonuclease RusA